MADADVKLPREKSLELQLAVTKRAAAQSELRAAQLAVQAAESAWKQMELALVSEYTENGKYTLEGLDLEGGTVKRALAVIEKPSPS